MAKNLNQTVSVKFTADSRELQKSVKSLQSQLQDLSTMKFSVDDGSLKKATESAKDLQKYLYEAKFGNIIYMNFLSSWLFYHFLP